MLPYDSISAIGMSPLGGLGLDYTGAYGSYSSPLTMGVGYPSFMGAGAMNPMMMGMYNPEFMKQIAQMQQQMETAQLNHSTNMYEAITQAELTNLSAKDRAIFQSISVDGEIQREVRTLGDVVRKGDSDAIIQEYDRLKAIVASKFASELKNKGIASSSLDIDRYIEIMYQQIVSKQTGEVADLRHDIKKYGENPFAHGFNSTFLGNRGHNSKYSEEVLSYIDGNTRINDKGSKDRAHKWGGYVSRVVEGLSAMAAGFTGGAAALGIAKIFAPGNVKFFGNLGKVGRIGAGVFLAGDILWQMTRSSEV